MLLDEGRHGAPRSWVRWQMPCLVPAFATTVQGVLKRPRAKVAWLGSRLLWQWCADLVSKIPRPSRIISQRRRSVAGLNV